MHVGFLLMRDDGSLNRKRVSFLRGDVTRAIKGAQAAGFDPGAIEICPNSGRILILSKEAGRSKIDPVARWEAEKRARKA